MAGETSTNKKEGITREEYSKKLRDLIGRRKELASQLRQYPQVLPEKMTTQELGMRRDLANLEYDIAQLREDYSLGVLESLEASTERLLDSSTKLEQATNRALESSKSLEWLTTLLLVITFLGVIIAGQSLGPLFSVIGGISLVVVYLLLMVYLRRRGNDDH